MIESTPEANFKISAIEYLKKHSTIVVDSGDLQLIRKFQVEDATTNPTLILQSFDKEETIPCLKKSLRYGASIWSSLKNNTDTTLENFSHFEIEQAKEDLNYCGDLFIGKTDNEIACELTIDYFIVKMGCEILKSIPGKVSTELPPQYSFDKNSSIKKAQHLIKLYQRENINKDRVLIKLATTWEGIKAAELLEKQGIHCNMTLLFSSVQAIAAAEASVSLISPFVGRILDWYKASYPNQNFNGAYDPGVQSVTNIYQYYKHFAYPTVIMAASFRNTSEIMELVGCDKLTISPKLLQELQELYVTPDKTLPINKKSDAMAKLHSDNMLPINEVSFRWQLNEDHMATEKLAEGIRNFHKDYQKLSKIINQKLIVEES